MKKLPQIALPEAACRLLDYLRSRGYAEASVKYYDDHFRRIARWMLEYGFESYTQEAYTTILKQITSDCTYETLTNLQKRLYHSAVILYEFQQTGNYTFRRKKAEEAIEGGIKAEIEKYLLHRQSLKQAETTSRQYHLDLLRFNIYLDEMGILDVSYINQAVVLRYIQERMSKFTQPTIRHALTSIRQFLLYLYESERVSENLSLVVPNYGARPYQRIPSTYSKGEIERLLSAMNRADSKGKRDYSMILLAARLGLRSSDICQLRFSELDWKQNRILLKQKKTNVPIELPLLPEIGEAIIDYLKYGRPKSELPFVFLKHIPPYDIVTGAAFTNAIKSGMRRAGIPRTSDRKHGPHALRHSLATILLEQNTPLPVISGILGHKNPETTKMYLRVDIVSLRKCTLSVPAIDPDYYDRRCVRW